MTSSAGILIYRLRDGDIEVLLVHPGGPFWKRKDEGAWSIPKGLPEPRRGASRPRPGGNSKRSSAGSRKERCIRSAASGRPAGRS